ncbi:hypothetical protein [Hymenobacter sp. GOD-10R]|uniref:hypothetical protein n=1 Tax=Hymenobacter sp. GOD-10R TaxID=3093922 RepID=UPI002D772F80|nr:hypothetical protein [Hymenobacter sp. GOD-10R]WRQ31727.1 hypothetical protein SD425_28870 [Hymenobacter sp. GOD-10R]
MSDVQVQKIKMVIELELRERAPNNPSIPDPDTDAESHGYEQALFAMLEADPQRYAEFVKILAIISLETLGIHNDIPKLAQIRDTYTANMQILRSLLPRFSSPAQAYLHKAIEQGWIMDSTDSIFNRVQVEPVSLRVEYPVSPSS